MMILKLADAVYMMQLKLEDAVYMMILKLTHAVYRIHNGLCYNKKIRLNRTRNFHQNCPNVLKFCTEHESITVVFWTTETIIMKKLDFARFQFRNQSRADLFIATGPWCVRLMDLIDAEAGISVLQYNLRCVLHVFLCSYVVVQA